jgi:hypothetical protein
VTVLSLERFCRRVAPEICIRSDKADGAMARREFATQKKFHHYAERTAQGYLWKARSPSPNVSGAPAPDQYDIVDVRTFRGIGA